MKAETPKDVPMHDLGDGRVLPHGTEVTVSGTTTDRSYQGTLAGTWQRNGNTYAVQVWTDHGMRHVTADRVAA